MEDLGLVEFLPDAQELFRIYNEKYFDNILIDVNLEWSEKMTRCAGICMLKPGGRVIIRLSRPLLQLRPFSDTIDTLIHEMIHAYFFVKQGGSIDRDGHGPDFCAFMDQINSREGTRITVYHSFHDEVDHYKKHIWRCNGPCKDFSPFFGWVKRSMNRKPQPADSWWANHQACCGGTFEKVSEPETASSKNTSMPPLDKPKFSGKGRTWSSETDRPTSSSDFFAKREKTSIEKFDCFNCHKFKSDSLEKFNEHLDSCLQKSERIIDLT